MSASVMNTIMHEGEPYSVDLEIAGQMVLAQVEQGLQQSVEAGELTPADAARILREFDGSKAHEDAIQHTARQWVEHVAREGRLH